MTHLIGYASAWGAYKMRRDIGRLKFGTFKKTHKMGISFMVDKDHGKNLAYVTVHDGHKMTLVDFAKQCQDKFKEAKECNDIEEYDKLAY